jgi:hypothetical protein
MVREEAMASAKRSTAAASRLGVQSHAFLGAVLAGGTPCAATRKCCRTLSAVDCSSTRAKYPGGYSKVAQSAASDTRAQGPYQSGIFKSTAGDGFAIFLCMLKVFQLFFMKHKKAYHHHQSE